MTRLEFPDAARRFSGYGGLLMGLSGSVVIIPASWGVLWSGLLIGRFGAWLRRWLNDEAVVGLVGGLAGDLVFTLLLLIL